MNKKKIIEILLVIMVLLAVLILAIGLFYHNDTTKNQEEQQQIVTGDYVINVTNLNYQNGSNINNLEKYTQDDFDKFYQLYLNNNLPDVYITEFLFDGVSMYKTYDLDDFIEGGNDISVKALKTTVFNVNTTGNISFTGEITGGMIAVNTNNVNKDINIILNNVKIDTDSKKIPAVYVYNKDVTYTDCKVTIIANQNTKNYLIGGKLKKVSLIPSDNLSNYTNKYNGTVSNYYDNYTNYYGVYTNSEINSILFAKVTADNEDLQDGDPYYYYKASGAIQI